MALALQFCIFLTLPLVSWLQNPGAMQKVWLDKYDWYQTKNWINKFSQVRPYYLPKNVSSTYFLELENMTSCDCPRVYWPTCGADEVTYLNACVLHCADVKFMHFGPCLLYRRFGAGLDLVRLPKQYNITKKQSEVFRRNYNVTVKEIALAMEIKQTDNNTTNGTRPRKLPTEDLNELMNIVKNYSLIV